MKRHSALTFEDWSALLRVVRDTRKRHGTRALGALERKVEIELAAARHPVIAPQRLDEREAP